MPSHRRCYALATGLLLALAACAPAPQKASDQAPLVWPEELDVAPRIAFVREFSRPADIGITRTFMRRLGELLFGKSEQRLVRPMAVIVVNGVVYVADPGARGVHRFDPSKGRYDLLVATGDRELPSPVALAANDRGDVYVTDSVLAEVLVIRPGARSAVTVELPKMGQPTGIAFDPVTGRTYVVDTTAHHVNVFGRDGALQSSFGQRGTGDGEFNYPTLLWRDPAGQLYVTDSLNFRIQVFDRDGRFIGKFGQAGDGPGDFMRQKGVATDSFGHVYIADALFNTLQIFDPSGQLLLSVGNLGSARGEFWLPAGVFIDADNTIYVADSYNRRIQVFRYIGGPT
jgi:DNA-binding beta-propeller fold protein YncE